MIRSQSSIACALATLAGALLGAAAVSPRAASAAFDGEPSLSAAEVVRAALVERVGARAEVTLHALDPAPDGAFREARPDPSAVFGKPVRITLIPVTGAALPTVASVEIVADHAIAKRAIGRGHVLTVDDVDAVRGPIAGIPLRAMPSGTMLTGARVLRPIAAGAVIQANFVAMRRAIEPGDRVTVTAISGPVEVSAVMVAADGGVIGATIRVLNPETRRLVKGRIVGEGLVEVHNGR